MRVEYLGFLADVYEEGGKTHLHVRNCGDSLHASFVSPDLADKEMAALIDDYIETCHVIGKQPEIKPQS